MQHILVRLVHLTVPRKQIRLSIDTAIKNTEVSIIFFVPLYELVIFLHHLKNFLFLLKRGLSCMKNHIKYLYLSTFENDRAELNKNNVLNE